MDSLCLLSTSLLPVTNTPKRNQTRTDIKTPVREEQTQKSEESTCISKIWRTIFSLGVFMVLYVLHFSDLKRKLSAVERLTKKIPKLEEYFTVHKKIGEGAFSNVFMATCKSLEDDKKFAIKHLTPTSHPSRIIQEMRCLMDIGYVVLSIIYPDQLRLVSYVLRYLLILQGKRERGWARILLTREGCCRFRHAIFSARFFLSTLNCLGITCEF